jgi:SAM-dependent methyltransferase
MSKVCKICGNVEQNKIVTGVEMMFQTREQFDYLECSGCGCLQILQSPSDISRYYPKDYYSFEGSQMAIPVTSGLTYFLKSKVMSHKNIRPNMIGMLLSAKYKNPFEWLPKYKLNFNSRILDVGSGAGHTLIEMYGRGFKNLTGIDPYIAAPITYNDSVRIKKTTLNEVREEYDFVMLHHSFEHMDKPLSVLKEIKRVLASGSYALIRIPVGNCYAYHVYAENWVQFDAPRHLFLHTTKSMRLLSEQAGLELTEVKFDSGPFQFWASEMYKKKIPLAEAIRSYKQYFTDQELEAFRVQSEELNETGQGDMACFYLYKPYESKA